MTAKWLAKIAKYRSSTIKDDDEDDPITPACGNAMRAIAGLTPSGAPPLGRETTDDSNDLRLERRTSTARRQSNDTSCDACGRGTDVSRHTTNKRESLADQLQQEVCAASQRATPASAPHPVEWGDRHGTPSVYPAPKAVITPWRKPRELATATAPRLPRRAAL
eukprot:2855440-Prymnesium_polylepis.1